jgi:hypothetical protein
MAGRRRRTQLGSDRRLDYIWASTVTDWRRIAIVDSATICHTRPVGGPNYRHVANGGKTPHQEMYEALSQYGVTAIDMPFVRGGIDHAGRVVSMYDGSARELIEAIVTGYLPEFAIHPDA